MCLCTQTVRGVWRHKCLGAVDKKRQPVRPRAVKTKNAPKRCYKLLAAFGIFRRLYIKESVLMKKRPKMQENTQ